MASEQLITVAGLSDLQKMLDTLPVRMEKNIMRSALRVGANVYRDRARNGAPVKSGNLKKSIKVKSQVRRGKVITQIVAGGGDVFYAKFIEFGTASFYEGSGKTVGGPYTIKPKNGKALKFGNIYAPSVTHEGVRPNGFMRRAFDGGESEAIQKTADYIRQRLDDVLLK